MEIEDKLFSENTGSTLYVVSLSAPEYDLYQRCFGIKEDILASGVSRTYKKVVGRARKKIAEKLRDKALKEYIQQQGLLRRIEKSGHSIRRREGKRNVEFLEDLKRNNPKIDFDISEGNVASSAIHSPKKAMEILNDKNLDGLEKIKKFHHTNPEIRLDPDDTIAHSLHELNHIKNGTFKNGVINGVIYRASAIGSAALEKNEGPSKNILGAAGKYIARKIREVEERNATKGALRELESVNIPDQLKKESRLDLYRALKTYETGHKASTLADLSNLIQIPSRTRK